MSGQELVETETPKLTIVLLAGDREGGISIAGVRTRKALLEIEGRTLFEIAMERLASFAPDAIVHILANDAADLAAEPRIARCIQAHGAVRHEGKGSPIESLVEWRRHHPGDGPVLVVTVDAPLTKPETLTDFRAQAFANEGDLAVGVVERGVLWSRFPGMKRSFLKLADGRFKGGNLFLLKTPAAWTAIEAWRNLETLRKSPWALLRRLNWRTAMRAALGRLTLANLFAEASRILGARIAPLRLDDAGLAADIDTPSHWQTVQTTLARETMHGQGKKIVAVFDLDRTITRFGTYTPFLLFSAWRMNKRRLLGAPIVLGLMALYRLRLLERARLKELMFELLVGPISLEALRPHIDAFASFVVRRGLRPGAVAALAYEKRNGAHVVMATAAPEIYARAIADWLGFEQLIATRMRIEDGKVLPQIENGNCYGERKQALLQQAIGEPAHIVFYTDDASDLPTLERVDQGFVINPRRAFARYAEKAGLPVLQW